MTDAGAPRAAAVVLDIEGTVSPTRSVHDQLFGYTRDRVGEWLRRPGAEAALVLARIAEYEGRGQVTPEEAAGLVRGWIDDDVKAAPLKIAQGLICHDGFAAGEMHGTFFPDAVAALRRWHDRGLRLFTFSSGSRRTQEDWFTHNRDGLPADLIEWYFDLESSGPKREPDSYRRITDAVALRPAMILFVSDVAAELDAAAAAGWQVTGVARSGEPDGPRGEHRWVSSFDELTPIPVPTESSTA